MGREVRPQVLMEDETEEHKEVPCRLGRGASRTLKLGMECDGHLGSEEGD
jgi:hypothetical protein